VQNTDVSSVTGLGPLLDPIIRHRSSLFGHVARLSKDTPAAHQAMRVPHRPVTQSPPRSNSEATSRPLSDQVAWPTPQGQRYTTCWPLVTHGHSGMTIQGGPKKTAHGFLCN